MSDNTAHVRTSVLLALSQFLYLSAASVGLAFSGLVGAILAENKALATLPFSMITVATAITTLFASRFMYRFGRRSGFLLGSVFGITGGVVSMAAIRYGAFYLFCGGAALLGIYQAFAQHYRYAAADNAPDDYKNKAISYVLVGGVLAAFVGPLLAREMKDLLPLHLFAGSYIGVAILAALSIPILMLLRLDVGQPKAASPATTRPLRQILAQGDTKKAMACCAEGYGVMIFVMTATPLAFVGCGHPVAGAASVIQWHLVAMFAPSLVTGRLLGYVGASKIAFIGIILEMAGAVIATTGTEPAFFYLALVLSGIGWNFMYVGGTSMLSHGFGPAERAKVQGLNEFITFGVVATCSAMAGWIYQEFGWQILNYIGITALVLFGVVYLKMGRDRTTQATAPVGRVS